MRKFRCIKDYKGKCGDIISKGSVLELKKKSKNSTQRALFLDGEWICDENSQVGREQFEEIIEPRIEFNLIGFEEGQEFTVRGFLSKFKVVGKRLYWLNSKGLWKNAPSALESIIDDSLPIELIKEPTEKEKLEQRMRELAEKHKQEMDELAEQVKSLQ